MQLIELTLSEEDDLKIRNKGRVNKIENLRPKDPDRLKLIQN